MSRFKRSLFADRFLVHLLSTRYTSVALLFIGVAALTHTVSRWIWRWTVGPESRDGRSQLSPPSLPPSHPPCFPPPTPPSRSLARTTQRRSKSCADVGTKVAPSAPTAALGVVKAKRLLEVSGHQGVMHGSQPGDGSSPAVKVRAAGRPGRCAQADALCVSVCLRVCRGVWSHEANAVCVLSNGHRVFRQIRQSVLFLCD